MRLNPLKCAAMETKSNGILRFERSLDVCHNSATHNQAVLINKRCLNQVVMATHVQNSFINKIDHCYIFGSS